MSAQQSQSSANDTTLYSPPADQIHSLQSSSGLQSQKINFENQLQSVAGSKRRIENDDEDQTPSKRVRMNDPEQDERFEKPSLEEQIRNLGPLFNVNQKRKGVFFTSCRLGVLSFLLTNFTEQRLRFRSRMATRI